MTLWKATVRDLGFCAYHNGTPRCMNPCEPGTPGQNEWWAGWDKAESDQQYIQMAELIFPDVKGTCEGCGSTDYTLRELNLRPDQVNRCYACTAAMRLQKILPE